ncbi:MAG: outer membrane beta-barrel protein [Endomicrobiales bacterium]|nr:outer membrane beta-barrel protein [Endomicrobiales bacterium]
MKKTVLIAAVMLVSMNVYGWDAQYKAIADVAGKGEIDMEYVGVFDMETATGFGFGIELFVDVSKGVQIGGGFEHQLMRKITALTLEGQSIDLSGQDLAFRFAPFFGSLKVYLDTEGQVLPFLKFNLGYNLGFEASDDLDGSQTTIGGGYYAIGGGFKINKNFNAEVMYSKSSGSTVAVFAPDIDLSYSKIGISIGYLFNSESIKQAAKH